MIRLLSFLFVIAQLNAFSQKEAVITSTGEKILIFDDGTWKSISVSDIDLEIPQSNKDSIVRHQAYSLLYSEEHEQALWVAYKLTEKDLVKKADRTDDFRSDPMISTGSADLSDYKGSGYDRGHLAPAGDMVRSQEVMSESFYFSNMSPQVPSFNRGEWRMLEEQVREWTKEFDSLYVVTGPVLSNVTKKIGGNDVSVPNQYYKVLLTKTSSGFQGIGFLMSNGPDNYTFGNYTVTIDEIETATGIDFYSELPDSIEKSVESMLCRSCWGFNDNSEPSFNSQNESTPPPIEGTSVQCKGKTNSGSNCKRKTSDPSGYCYQHKK